MFDVGSKTKSRAFLTFMVVVSLGIFTGCGGGAVKVKDSMETKVRTTSVGNSRLPQTHFTFPNSNVIPIGTAAAKATARGNLDNFPDMSGANKTALDKAVASKGGDLMINTTIDGTLISTTRSGMRNGKYIIEIDYLYEVVVQGTVAKMEIGKQKLR